LKYWWKFNCPNIFSAGAAEFSKVGNNLEITGLALNKRYENDKSNYDIEFVIEGYNLNGDSLFTPITTTYSVPHFTKLALGKYARGIDISHTLDLSLDAFSTDYYIKAYVIDKTTMEVINLPSYYLVITPAVTHRPH